MLISNLKKTILTASRWINPAIIDATKDQKYRRVQPQCAEWERYEIQVWSMQLIQVETEAGLSNVKVA